MRDILIEYIKSVSDEVRIYQEKSIGAAVFDVMAVSDRLAGYEIKSDADNYQRLERQIRFYNDFFDENYIVVGKKHHDSSEKKVPASWGIVYIDDSGIQVLRNASKNPDVSRRSQLSLLWKLELKNLLIQNNLPLYAQKGKGYISNQICRSVAHEILGRQIAGELLHRDYSVYDAKDYTIYKKKEIFSNMPVQEIIDSPSEQNFDQITLDQWIELYNSAKQIQKETVCIKKEVNREHHDISYKDIEVSLGAPWIGKNIINEFVNHIVFGDISSKVNFAEYEPITGGWFINRKKGFDKYSNVTAKYGTPRYNALYIIEATLNLREIKIYNQDGNKLDEDETIAVLEKQKLIDKEFKNWVWLDEDRKWQIEEAYNKMFSCYKKHNFDGSKLDFPEMSTDFNLFDYQKDAVQRIISSSNTLLAFDVGAGKTYIMIAAAMKMREMGISQKNMFVVPNNIVGQWEKIFTTLYPEAKVLTVEPKSFKPQRRQKVLSQIKNGSYDGIIIAYSCFELIPLSVEFITENMQRKVDEIKEAMQALKGTSNNIWGKSRLLRELKYIKKGAGELIKGAEPYSSEITFDSLEINTLFLDEAHNYKNIPIRTTLKNLRGISTKGSKKCLEMMQKIRYVQQNNNGRGAVLATGTPLCNSISDAYAMQMYLQYYKLCEHHLERFDNWIKTFAKPEQMCEVDVTAANYRFVRRFSKFFNLPELSKMFSDVAAFYSLSDNSDLPAGAQYIDETIKRCDSLADYMHKIYERTEDIRNKCAPANDNMLKICTDGRKAALDLSLVNVKQPYNEYSKLVRCAENVTDIYENFPGCSQLVFCDYSIPKPEEFNVYEKLKELLIKKGISEKEIAFVHSYKSESSRLKLYESVNNGEIRVLIGSTFKLGIGANVQTKLKAIHHLDVPWRPADMTQREGRILRKGNENNEIMIYRYITEGSFDSYSWQILETKQRFISQFLIGSSYQRSIEDLDNNVLSYAEVKAIALSEPIMKQIAEKENEIKTLQILCNKYAENKRILKERISELAKEIENAKKRVDKTVTNKKYLSGITNEKYIAEKKAINVTLSEKTIKEAVPGNVLLSFLGFDILPAKQHSDKKMFVVLRRSNIEYLLELSTSPSGNIKRIVNFLKRFNRTVESERKSYEKLLNEYNEAKTALNLPNKHYEELLSCKQDLSELMKVAKRNQLL